MICMYVLMGEFRLPAARMDEAREMMRKVVEATREEEGCLHYAYAEDVLDPGLVRVSELWVSEEALDDHLRSPHMRVWAEERAALGLTDRNIKRYTVTGVTVV